MKKSGVIKAVITILIILLIVGVYYFFTTQRRTSVEDTVELTEIQKLITKNLDTNYPATPREVVKYYNRILECLYDDTYTDDELLENNPRDQYLSDLKADIEDYHNKSKTIRSSNVCDSNDVVYQTVDGRECAYVTASYFMNENNSFDRTNEMYVLRKDDDGDWKILVFYQVEGDSSDEQ